MGASAGTERRRGVIGELGRQVDVLTAAPAADLQAEAIHKVGPLLDPLLHHLADRWAALGAEPRITCVAKRADGFDTVLVGPLPTQTARHLEALSGGPVIGSI